jgi:LEA14-like dessication related protein
MTKLGDDMKKLKFIALLFIGTSFMSCTGSSTVEIGQKTEISVNPVFDAGKVMHGEEIVATFEVKNEGSYPLVIAEVKGSCSCTVAEKPEEPIQPGKTGIIKATVKTESTSAGKISKEVRIVANTEPSVTVMKINAEVIRK